MKEEMRPIDFQGTSNRISYTMCWLKKKKSHKNPTQNQFVSQNFTAALKGKKRHCRTKWEAAAVLKGKWPQGTQTAMPASPLATQQKGKKTLLRLYFYHCVCIFNWFLSRLLYSTPRIRQEAVQIASSVQKYRTLQTAHLHQKLLRKMKIWVRKKENLKNTVLRERSSCWGLL